MEGGILLSSSNEQENKQMSKGKTGRRKMADEEEGMKKRKNQMVRIKTSIQRSTLPLLFFQVKQVCKIVQTQLFNKIYIRVYINISPYVV